MKNNIKFFLGANSKKGFVSYFDGLQTGSLQLIILKGGPGSGKSSLMKRVAALLVDKNHEIVYFPCASDPSSLDAFVDKSLGFGMVDGTAPHVLDPVYPGALGHIINLGECWDTQALYDTRLEIISLTKTIASYHQSATAYIKAGAALLEENYTKSAPYMKRESLFTLAARIGAGLAMGYGGYEEKRLLSAVTVGEIQFFSDTLRTCADKIYSIEDPFGSASDYLLKKFREEALGRGVDIISCPCSINPDKLEHIIIPSERIALTTSLPSHSMKKEATATIEEMYESIDNRSLFEKRIIDSERLLNEAAKCVEKAKKLHDELEAFYVSAMDYSKIDKIFENIVTQFC